MRWWSLQVRWGMNADTLNNEVPEMVMESHLLSLQNRRNRTLWTNLFLACETPSLALLLPTHILTHKPCPSCRDGSLSFRAPCWQLSSSLSISSWEWPRSHAPCPCSSSSTGELRTTRPISLLPTSLIVSCENRFLAPSLRPCIFAVCWRAFGAFQTAQPATSTGRYAGCEPVPRCYRYFGCCSDF